MQQKLTQETSLISESLPVQIRPMQEKDISQVVAIDQLSFSMPWPERAYRYELKENPHSLLWVAELEAKESSPAVIGLVVVWIILDEAHIASIAVHPDFRGQGIAQRLLASALIGAYHSQVSQATLEVRAGNQAAQKLYRRFGFDTVGLRPRYYQDNQEDALIMTLYNLGESYLEWLAREGWKTETAPRGGEL